MDEQQTCHCNPIQVEDYGIVKKMLVKYQEVKGALIPAMHEVQDYYGYLPKDALKIIAEELNVTLSEIYGVATFYSHFSTAPKGKHLIRVCLGTACYVKGAEKVLERLSKELNSKVNETTEDGNFTLESTRCLGACGLAPVFMVNETVYGRIAPSDVPRILKKYHQEEGYDEDVKGN